MKTETLNQHARAMSSQRKTQQPGATMLCKLMLPALILSVSACSTLSPPSLPQTCPAVPEMPAISQPLPAVSYSLSAQQKFSDWRGLVTGTPATSKP